MSVSLVLLPGLDGTGELFKPLLRVLPENVQPVVLSYPAQQSLDYPALKRFVLERLPCSEFVLLGESFSGPVAVLVAAERPTGLLGLILCASFVSAPRQWFRFAIPFASVAPIHVIAGIIGPRMTMGRFRTPELAESMAGALAQVPERVIQSRLLAVAHANVSAELGGIDLPSLYLQGSEDALVPKGAVEGFSRTARRGNVEVVQGPHFVLQCVPSDACRSIVRFVEGLRRAV